MQIPINIEAKNYCFQCISPPSMFKLIQCFNMTRSLYEGDLLNCASVYCLIVSHYLQLFFIDFSLIEMHTHWLRGFPWHLSPDLDNSSCRQPPPPLPWLMSPVQWMPVFAGLVQGLSGGYWAEQETVQWHPVIIITRHQALGNLYAPVIIATFRPSIRCPGGKVE